jgi:hypothetical protein
MRKPRPVKHLEFEYNNSEIDEEMADDLIEQFGIIE